MLNFNKPKAFTLAELLIVLGIVGVVAAMAIPSLYNHFKKVELHARFNKTYSVMRQALKLTLGDMGLTTPSDVTIYYDSDNTKLKENFVGINKVWESKFIGATKVKASTYTFKPVRFYFFGEPSQYAQNTHEYYYLLQDGSLISDIGANKRYGGVVALDIFFDTNGFHKVPNRLGYDQFYYYNEGEIKPFLGDVDYKLDCDPLMRNRVSNGACDKMQFAACSGYAIKDVNPFDSSKKYWDSLFKPKSWWEELEAKKK